MITSHKHDAICSTLLNHASLSKIRCKHSACLAIGSKIISLGINNKRTKWNNEIFCCSHSEIQCIYNWINCRLKGSKNKSRIRKVKKKLKKMTLYVIRKSGEPEHIFSNSKPCKLCLSKIKLMNIKKIIYSNDNGKLEKYNNTTNLENKHLSHAMKKLYKKKYI